MNCKENLSQNLKVLPQYLPGGTEENRFEIMELPKL